MPRRLPRYDHEFLRQTNFALRYIGDIEQARVLGVSSGRKIISIIDLEFSYELAFLRVFLAWEALLENTFLRLMCGYHHSDGREPLVSGGTYYGKIVDAEMVMLDGKSFKLWHNPEHVISRAKRFFHGSRYELIIASAQARLEQFAAVRHRIAHSQKHAQLQFDQATMSMAGKRYRASRPGRFLRDWATGSNPPARWISVISQELAGLAEQICK